MRDLAARWLVTVTFTLLFPRLLLQQAPIAPLHIRFNSLGICFYFGWNSWVIRIYVMQQLDYISLVFMSWRCSGNIIFDDVTVT